MTDRLAEIKRHGHSKNDVDWLIAEVEQLEQQLASLQEEMKPMEKLACHAAELLSENKRLKAAIAEAESHVGKGLAAMSHEAYKTHCVDAMAALRSNRRER